MALINGANYDHIDLQGAQGGDIVRHMLQDTEAREDISTLVDAVEQILARLNALEQREPSDSGSFGVGIFGTAVFG